MMSSLFVLPSLLLALFGDPLDSVVVQSDRRIESTEKFENVIVLQGNLQFFGEAETLVLLGGSATLEPGSKVTKSLVLIRGTVEQRDGAEVAEIKGKGDYALFDFWAWSRLKIKDFKEFVSNTFNWELPSWEGVGSALGVFFFVFLSFVTFMIFLSAPGIGSQTTQVLKNSPAWTFLLGVFFSMSLLPILLLSIISIVGIFLIPFILLIYAGFFWIGYFCFARCIGQSLFGILRIKMELLSLIGGLIVLIFLGQLPFVGFWISLIACLMGCGAFLLGLFGARIYVGRRPSV